MDLRGDEDSEEEAADHSSDDEEFFNLPALRLLQHLLGSHHSYNITPSEEEHIPAPKPMEITEDLYYQVKKDCGQKHKISSNCENIFSRQLQSDSMSMGGKVSTTVNMLPQFPNLVDIFDSRVFCGVYSKDGSLFLSSCQDSKIHLYNTMRGKFERYKTVSAHDVGWSILDSSFSPDQHWFIYSTWSPSIHICNVWSGEEDKHYSLNLRPNNEERFCAFAARFSGDGDEIIASASDGCLYVYDRQRCDRILKIDAHQDDANAVEFADNDSNIIYSGGDDGLCKVWDRRNFSEVSPKPVGLFSGHKDGITFINSKGDGRYLISNSKDQTIKLWDIRKFSQDVGIEATLKHVSKQSWDYRWQNVPKRSHRISMKKLPGDTSVMTYGGHLVKHSLLRCRFSPIFTTGQRYIYTASANGRVIVYDVLTGEIVKQLESEKCNCIRDVSWHPFEPGELVAASWDGILQMWTHRHQTDYFKDDT